VCAHWGQRRVLPSLRSVAGRESFNGRAAPLPPPSPTLCLLPALGCPLLVVRAVLCGLCVCIRLPGEHEVPAWQAVSRAGVDDSVCPSSAITALCTHMLSGNLHGWSLSSAAYCHLLGLHPHPPPHSLMWCHPWSHLPPLPVWLLPSCSPQALVTLLWCCLLACDERCIIPSPWPPTFSAAVECPPHHIR